MGVDNTRVASTTGIQTWVEERETVNTQEKTRVSVHARANSVWRCQRHQSAADTRLASNVDATRVHLIHTSATRRTATCPASLIDCHRLTRSDELSLLEFFSLSLSLSLSLSAVYVVSCNRTLGTWLHISPSRHSQ